MQDKLEELIKIAYRRWKAQQRHPDEPHPDQEALVCFLEGRVSAEEERQMKKHLISCEKCIEELTVRLKLQEAGDKDVPAQLLQKLKSLIETQAKCGLLEIVLKFKENITEVLKASGDILVGQELIPAPVLRSRKTKEFKDEVTVLKDVNNFRVEVKIENKGGRIFDLTVIVKEKQTQKIIRDLRVTLLKEDIERESYLTDSGKAVFENVLLGNYAIQISSLENKVAVVLLDIKT